jgi:molecular chaperone DnaK (HSP70)
MALNLGHWIGIDLGTYNSSAAVKTKQGTVEIIKSLEKKSKSIASFIYKEEQYKEFPSFISFNKDGSINEVGMNSKEKAHSEPEFVVWGVKRLLGKTYTELKESGELERFPYRIRPNRTNGQCLIFVGEKSYTPEQLCAEIFKKIKSDAKSQLKEEINSIIVSVPAYFDPLRVTPITEAAKLAGFINIKTIPEPVAAALAYHIEITVRPIKVLVFDLGAGTLDVTTGYLYRPPDQADEFRFQVIKNTGDSKLGGIDMDDRILKSILKRCGLTDVAPSDKAALRRMAEVAKIRLSNESKIDITFQLDGKEYQCMLGQMDLASSLEGEQGEKDLLEECRRQIMAAIAGAGWIPEDVECLIMIGGPTKLPCIHEVFKIIFYSNPIMLQQLEEFYKGKEKIDRMGAVSIGAALSIDHKVDDKVPYGYGIENIVFHDKEIAYVPKILIPRDSPYPFKSEQYGIEWVSPSGIFEFKIIQHAPESEIEQSEYEYKFIGIQKFAVKNPHDSVVVLHMGYNANKELVVTIKNAFANESVTYVGVNQFTSIGINYPIKVKIPTDVTPGTSRKVSPASEVIEKFVNWAQVTVGFIQRKVDNFPIPQMFITQNIDEINRLLKKEEPTPEYEQVYTKLNSLIWNSNSVGILTKNEHNELTKHLAECENELFRLG